MTVDKHAQQPPVARNSADRSRWVRPACVAAGAAAAVLTWTVIRYAAGVHVQTPAPSASADPTNLSPGMVLVVAAVAGAAGWGVVALLERRTRHPRRFWLLTAGLATVISLSGPLSGHGVSGGDRLSLICLHLAVAAVVIPGLAVTTRSQRPWGS